VVITPVIRRYRSEPIEKVYLMISRLFVRGVNMSAYKWAILLLVTVSLLASACTVASAQSPGGVVKIISPQKNGNAGPTERVSGKAQLSKGYSLWIVPYDPTSGKYYPEAPPLTVKSDATWSTRLSVGTIFGVGKTFQIHAVVADQSASTALSSYAAQRAGITKLPQGAQAVDAVTVKRVATDVAGAPSASPSPSAVPRTTSTAGSSTTAGASNSTANVAQASAAASSQNPLPGFEALYALGALAAVFLLLRVTRRS
jgi:hypothetical protein